MDTSLTEKAAAPEPAAASNPSIAKRLSAIQELGLIGVVLALGLLLSIYGYSDALPGRANTFLNSDNLIDGIATPMSYYAIMAIGVTIVIDAGGIDISVGSAMALAGMVAAAVMHAYLPSAGAAMAIPVAFILTLGVGLACGMVNGVLVSALRIHPFIVTLGTLSIYRCLATAPFSTKTIPAAAPLRARLCCWMIFTYPAGCKVTPLEACSERLWSLIFGYKLVLGPVQK